MLSANPAAAAITVSATMIATTHGTGLSSLDCGTTSASPAPRLDSRPSKDVGIKGVTARRGLLAATGSSMEGAFMAWFRAGAADSAARR